MLNFLSRFLRLRVWLSVLRSPFSWSSILFMLIAWFSRRKR